MTEPVKLNPIVIPDSANIAKSKPKKARKAKVKPEPVPGELPGMPPLDGVGRAARRYVEAIEAHGKAADEKSAAEANLIRALRRDKRTGTQFNGYKMAYNHTPAKDSIKVQKPK